MLYVHMIKYYLAIKRDGELIHATTLMNLENNTKWKKPDTKDHLLHDSTYIRFPEQGNRDRK